MKINGNEYKIPELNFNTVCDLEDMGVNLAKTDRKVLSTVRGFLALAMGGDFEKAGRELELHLSNGGELDELMKEMNEAIETSGFFQTLTRKKATKSKTK